MKFVWPQRGGHPVRSAGTGSARTKDTCSVCSRLRLRAGWLISMYTDMCRIYKECVHVNVADSVWSYLTAAAC